MVFWKLLLDFIAAAPKITVILSERSESKNLHISGGAKILRLHFISLRMTRKGKQHIVFVSLEILFLKGGGSMQEFHCKTKILSGANALDWLKDCSCKTLLVVTDPYFMKNGTAQAIAQRVQAEQREFFDGVKPDPSVELAAEGTALMRQYRPDLLIALGGGSAMDTAKAMVYFAGEGIKFVAIPTTSGSGSEVTDFAILTHDGVKHPLVDRRMQPDIALISAELVEKLPPSLVADGGFDVLSHALEALAATNATPLTDALATGAFLTAFHLLPASFRGDVRVRGQIHLASTMAGLAFTQSGLGLCHALSHSLGGIFHLPHGRLNAILLPEVVACNAETVGERYASLAKQAGLGANSQTMGVRNLRNALIRLRKELHLPATLQEAGIPPHKLRQHRQEIIAAALADPCMATNPGKVDVGKVLDLVSGRG